MKIGIDISQIIYGTGVSVYTKNIVTNLIKLFPEDTYVLFGGSLRRRQELVSFAKKLKTPSQIYPFSPAVLDFVWNSLHLVPIDWLLRDIDIFHCSDWTEPPSRIPKVTTVHDLIPFKYPLSTTSGIIRAHRTRLHWAIRESDRIIAVSRSTRDDLVSILKVSEDKITVIPEGVESRFCPQPLEIIEQVKKRYHIMGNYIFSLSTLETRKNQQGLIEAYSILRQTHPELILVIGGKTGWGSQPQPIPGVLMLGFVPDADLPALYAGASCFALPSFYEGFGLPPLQAMACGTPVVVSNTSSFPEVVGSAGILVDPNSPPAIASGIINAIDQSRKLREQGLIQSQKFTWEKSAQETHRVYQEVINLHKK